MTLKNLQVMGTAVFLSAVLIGCPKAKSPQVDETIPETNVVVGSETSPDDNTASALSVGTDWMAAPGFLNAVTFGFMTAELSEEARTTLKSNAVTLKTILKAAPGVRVRVEGHCDERGTLEYNLALGQRRANAVSNYYASLGVARSALSTVSYGEERPACSQSDESCWAQNRRGETTLRSTGAPLQIPLGK